MINIREVRPNDWGALQKLFLESRRQTYTWAAVDGFQLTDLDRETRDERILVAEDQASEIIGFISMQDHENFIHHLYVESLHQSRGVGRALLMSLPNWPNATYRLKCLRQNHQAMSFYENCGFIAVDSGVAEHGKFVLFEHRQGVT